MLKKIFYTFLWKNIFTVTLNITVFSFGVGCISAVNSKAGSLCWASSVLRELGGVTYRTTGTGTSNN